MSGPSRVAFCAVAVLLAMAAAAHAAPIVVDIPIAGTGSGSAGRDANYVFSYSVTYDPSISPGVLPAPAPGNGVSFAYIVNQYGWPVIGSGWNGDTGGSKWIGPAPQFYYNLLNAPAGYYTYQTTFTIPDNVNLSTVLLWGGLSSDNCTVAIGINGGAVSPVPGSTALMVPGTCLAQGHQFQIGGSAGALNTSDPGYFATAALHTGINTIQFVVRNSDDAPPNPTGLVVWWIQADGLATPEASTVTLLAAGLAVLAWLRRRGLTLRA
jgi:hypothetical protein